MANDKETIVSLKDLQISFGSGKDKFVAVQDVNFDIFKGETFSLVGESGSGKTTIGRAILGINPTEKGPLPLKGNRSTARSLKRRSTQSNARFR